MLTSHVHRTYVPEVDEDQMDLLVKTPEEVGPLRQVPPNLEDGWILISQGGELIRLDRTMPMYWLVLMNLLITFKKSI